jgi:hypothetical protein
MPLDNVYQTMYLDLRYLFRTGTALRFVRRLMATAMLVATTLTGLSRQVVETNAAERIVHDTGPGAIGAARRTQPGPRPEQPHPAWVQDVEISGPGGLMIAIETPGGWSPLERAPLRLGLVIGQGYRLRVAGLPGAEGVELFPSVRVLAKLAAPPGAARRFPVEIAIDEDDLREAAAGAHVRRIVYASCEPDRADILPGSGFDVRPGDDALAVAATLGDPVAELVIGNRLPAPGFVP